MKQIDPESGFTCFELRSGPMQIGIVPEAGSNVYSIRHHGREFLKTPRNLKHLLGFLHGVPVLYPTPGRVADGNIFINGEKIALPSDPDFGCIHGIVHSVPWQVTEESSSHLCTQVEFKPGAPPFQYLPVQHTLCLRVEVTNDSICWEYTVNNEGPGPLPFGFGLHPWFLRGDSEVQVQIPSEQKLELADGMPTGKVVETDARFRDGARFSVTDDSVDDVFLVESGEPSIRLQSLDEGNRVDFSSSQDFKYVVLYMPKGEPWVCPENWTCCPNSHNVFDSGLNELSGLRTVGVGESYSGWVKMQFARQEPDID